VNYPAATAAGPTLDWVCATLERRRQDRGVIFEQMRRARDAYNGDIVIPLPELDRAEEPAVPNLIAVGLDQTAQRIASVLPDVYYPPLRPGFKGSEEKARTRRQANLAWWEANKMGLKLRRRARWLIGYGEAPAVIGPDMQAGIPRWNVRDPLSSYPAPMADPDALTPDNAIFTYRKPWSWLRDRYPAQVALLRTGYQQPHQCPGGEQFELVEYCDADVTVLAVLGKADGSASDWTTSAYGDGASFVELERVPNRSGISPVVAPGRITLERGHGQYDGSIGMYQMQARLMALEVIAVERGIFPDTYLVSRPNETAQFLSGPHDGRTGQVNLVKGGDIREVNLNPGFATTNVIDRLERAQRLTAGVPAEYGGESATNVRTGKRGDAVLAAITDFPIQEAQELLAEALQEENRRAVAVAKAYFGNQPKSFLVSLGKGKPRSVDYTPADDFESDVNKVTYAMAGADQNGLIIGIGQRVGLGMMSKRTGQEIDPLISDPEAEHDRVVGEALEAAVLASLQQQAQAGAVPLPDIARIAELVTQDKADLVQAIMQAQREAQERQAASGEPGTPTGPVEPGSPEAQPGLAMPDAGMEQPTVAPPAQGPQNLADLLNTLRQPARMTRAERGAPVA